MDENRPRRSAQALLSLSALCLLVAIVALGTFGPGCRDENTIPVDRNLAPETFLTGAPGDSQAAFYAVRLYWSGIDQDGEVVGYEYAVTESLPDLEAIEYEFTTKTDSLFRFQVESSREILGHRFYVRAIDNDGKVDPVPAWAFFAARNICPPAVEFTQAIAFSPDFAETLQITSTETRERSITDTVPTGWSVCFEWEGSDCDAILDDNGEVHQVGSIQRYFRNLAPREFSELGGTINDTTVCYNASELSSGPFFFRVRAVDDAGYSGSEIALRSFVWNRDPITRFERIFDPDTGDSVQVVYVDTIGSGDEFVPVKDGDTIPLPSAGISIRLALSAYDPDDPSGNGEVVGYESRIQELSARYDDLPISDPTWETSLTDRNALKPSATYTIQGRSTDKLERDGTPTTIRLYPNRPARFLTSGEFFGAPFEQFPQEGDVLSLPAGTDSIAVEFLAVDPDRSNPRANLMEYRTRFDLAPGQTGGAFSAWVRGETAASYFRQLVGLRTGSFIPGEYIFTIEAQEFRSGSNATLVKRRVRRSVKFTVVEG